MRTNQFVSILLVLVSIVLGIVVAQSPALAQSSSSSSDDWQTLRPEGDEFTVVMPKDPKIETSEEPYHKMVLNTRLYLSVTERGPVFAVVSLSGIKSNPAMYSEFARLNSYVDAFKHWFPQKVRGKDAVAKLTLVGDKTLNGHAGREYQLVIGDLSGTAQVYATRKRFYAAVSLSTKKDDALTERFLSSFVLPEKVAEPPATAAAAVAEQQPTTEPQAGPKPAKRESGDDSQKPEPAPAAGGETKPAEAPTTPGGQPGGKPPISGGVLNGRALSLPPPEYPPELREVTGTVVVQVVIDEAGNVISARAVSGPPLLQPASVSAAQQAKFQPTFLMGEPVKVTGVLTYNFVRR